MCISLLSQNQIGAYVNNGIKYEVVTGIIMLFFLILVNCVQQNGLLIDYPR